MKFLKDCIRWRGCDRFDYKQASAWREIEDPAILHDKVLPKKLSFLTLRENIIEQALDAFFCLGGLWVDGAGFEEPC